MDWMFGFVSWITSEYKEKFLNFIYKATCPILCGHFEINGFEVTRGYVFNSGINGSLFDKFDKIFSGHFHIRATKGKISYLGNPYQTNWGEYGYDKGFHVFDTKTLQFDFVKNTENIYHSETYDESIDILTFNEETYLDKIVRIFYESEKNNQNKFNLFLERITYLAHNVEVIENKQIQNSDIESNLETVPTTDLIMLYLDSQEIHLDKTLLKKYVFELYKAALEKPQLSFLTQ